MNAIERIALIGQIIYLAILLTGSIFLAIYGSYEILAYGTILSLVSLVLIAPKTISERAKIVKEKIMHLKELIAIEDIIPLDPITALRPVRFRLKIKNPLKTFGLRLRFRSYDYINPSSLDLFIAPGEKTEKEIIIVPSGSGRREFSVAIAPLFDENNNLIPSHEADDVEDQKFAYVADEPVAGGLSSKQRSILNSIIRFALFFSASGLVYLSILQLSGLETLLFILTQVMPLVMILQVPALMLLFWLEKRLPEKPSFIFEEEE
ncbi:MAG: hypothetical protein ACP6IQ_06860 [Candidatus Njordarchaeia archaeon]|nr:hypothetical protein [Candidatus Korarchaeota archaeon]